MNLNVFFLDFFPAETGPFKSKKIKLNYLSEESQTFQFRWFFTRIIDLVIKQRYSSIGEEKRRNTLSIKGK